MADVKKPKSHHTKNKKGKGDYLGWILRTIDNVEEIRFADNMFSWIEFGASKLENAKTMTSKQMEAWVANSDIATELYGKVGVTPRYGNRYRDNQTGRVVKLGPEGEEFRYKERKTGRFITVPVDRVKTEQFVNYRNTGDLYGQRLQTVVSKAKINKELRDHISALGVRVKEKTS